MTLLVWSGSLLPSYPRGYHLGNNPALDQASTDDGFRQKWGYKTLWQELAQTRPWSHYSTYSRFTAYSDEMRNVLGVKNQNLNGTG